MNLTEDQILTKLREDWNDDRRVVLGFYGLYEILRNTEKILCAAYGRTRKSRMPELVNRISTRRLKLREALGLMNETEARYANNVSMPKTNFTP